MSSGAQQIKAQRLGGIAQDVQAAAQIFGALGDCVVDPRDQLHSVLEHFALDVRVLAVCHDVRVCCGDVGKNIVGASGQFTRISVNEGYFPFQTQSRLLGLCEINLHCGASLAMRSYGSDSVKVPAAF